MSKHFLINPKKENLSKEIGESIKKSEADTLRNAADNYRKLSNERIESEEIPLKHVEGRIIIKIDIDSKDIHTLEDGTQIYRGRRFNNLNVRETSPVNAWVVDAEYISKGSEILVHPNSIHDSNRIFNYGSSGIEQGNSVRYYSIEEPSAFLFREGTEWKPLKGFATGLRIFEPYKGIITGIPPKKIENVLYICSGEYSGKAAQTLKACDYEIVFTGISGREERIIRCRHYEGYDHDREEIIIERNDLTKKINNGQLLIGLSENDAKKLN
jgi:hypothetical protein